jgi:hypothetical protein
LPCTRTVIAFPGFTSGICVLAEVRTGVGGEPMTESWPVENKRS